MSNTGLTAYTVYLKADVYDEGDCCTSAELVPDNYEVLEENISLQLDADLKEFIQPGQRYKVTITRAEEGE